jgi:hypothetical protein
VLFYVGQNLVQPVVMFVERFSPPGGLWAKGALRATAYRFCASRAGLEPTGIFAFIRP